MSSVEEHPLSGAGEVGAQPSSVVEQPLSVAGAAHLLLAAVGQPLSVAGAEPPSSVAGAEPASSVVEPASSWSSALPVDGAALAKAVLERAVLAEAWASYPTAGWFPGRTYPSCS